MTVTLNPALDISTSAADIRPGPKLRCATPSFDPGGGGLNVSRAIAFLGGTSRAIAAIGGSVGLHLASLLQREEIDLVPFPIKGETRQSLSVTDTFDGAQYRFVLPGPSWTETEAQGIMDLITSHITGATILAISGSSPPGVPAGFITDLHHRLQGDPVRLVVDVSGPTLREMVNNPCQLHILRMDAAEAETLAGTPLDRAVDAADFASDLVAQGVAEIVLVARGKDGSIMATENERQQCRCVISEVRSKVGAGDSFVAGMILALSKGADDTTALRHGTAAASAAVLTEATDLCKHDDVLNLLEECEMFSI